VAAAAVRVKICGLTRRDDAVAAARAGADYLGVVLSPGFPRSVLPVHAAEVVAGLPAVAVAVLVDESVTAARAAAEAVGVGVIQLSGREPPQLAAALRAEGTWQVWKAVRVRSAVQAAAEVERYAPVVDGVLLEGWRVGSVGGTGARLGLAEAERVRRGLAPDLTVVVAGGLTPETVREAVRSLQPDVVDVSSGVERGTPGRKDVDRVRRFVENAKGTNIP